MKWFRHQSNAHKGELLQELYTEFGVHVGYSLYFRLVEYLTDKWDGIAEPNFKISELELRKFLGVSRKYLKRFSVVFELQPGNEFKISEKFLEIKFPKLLEILHRDAMAAGLRPTRGRPESGQEEKRREENRVVEERASAPTAAQNASPAEQGAVAALQGNLLLDRVLSQIPIAIQKSWGETYDTAWLKITLVRAIEHHMSKRSAQVVDEVQEWNSKFNTWLRQERTPKFKAKAVILAPKEPRTPWPAGAKERVLGSVGALEAMAQAKSGNAS